MDIEGSERKALQGGAAVLRRCKPRLSITTYHHPRDWRDLPAEIRRHCPDYRFSFKGLGGMRAQGLQGEPRPMMVHGWVGSG